MSSATTILSYLFEDPGHACISFLYAHSSSLGARKEVANYFSLEINMRIAA